jgi:hypothetical protein
MVATVAGIHLGIDTHANRPAANTVPDGSIYSCSTHNLVYKSNYAGNSWATWATLGGTGIADQGAFTYLDATDQGSDPASPAAGKHRFYAKAGGLYVKDSSGTVVGALGTGGGGGDAILRQSGGGGARISGLQGSADIVPGSAGAIDKEFDSSTLGGAAVGTPTTIDADTTAKGHLYINLAAAAGTHWSGRAWSWSPSNGHYVKAKLADYRIFSNYNRVALFVGEATPGAMRLINVDAENRIATLSASSPTNASYITQLSGRDPWAPIYFRIVYNSSTSLDLQFSRAGLTWTTVSAAVNPGFTVGSAGLVVSNEDGTSGHDVEAFWDWIRSS